jgi:hypothetical protein
LNVTIALASAVTDRSAVGELVEGRVVGNVIFQKKIVIPDGATVHGRIRRMERSTEMGGYSTLGFEFTDIEAPGVSTPFFASLETAGPLPGFAWSMTGGEVRTVNNRGATITIERESIRPAALPGVGTFFMRGAHFEIPKGWKMVWKTQSL